jgi:hypothetical protein
MKIRGERRVLCLVRRTKTPKMMKKHVEVMMFLKYNFRRLSVTLSGVICDKIDQEVEDLEALLIMI